MFACFSVWGYRATWRLCEWRTAPLCHPRRQLPGSGPAWCTRSRLRCLSGERETVNQFRKHAECAVFTWCSVGTNVLSQHPLFLQSFGKLNVPDLMYGGLFRKTFCFWLARSNCINHTLWQSTTLLCKSDVSFTFAQSVSLCTLHTELRHDLFPGNERHWHDCDNHPIYWARKSAGEEKDSSCACACMSVCVCVCIQWLGWAGAGSQWGSAECLFNHSRYV